MVSLIRIAKNVVRVSDYVNILSMQEVAIEKKSLMNNYVGIWENFSSRVQNELSLDPMTVKCKSLQRHYLCNND